LPPPADKNCIDAIFIWKSNKPYACQPLSKPTGVKTEQVEDLAARRPLREEAR
jgi:hypothetical protein